MHLSSEGLLTVFQNLPSNVFAEYESDQYDREVRLNDPEEPSAFNFALAWQPIANTMLRLSWLRGDTLGITLSSQVETKRNAPRRYEKRTQPINVDSNTGLPEGLSLTPGMTGWFESEQSGLYLKQASLREGERKATMVIENRL